MSAGLPIGMVKIVFALESEDGQGFDTETLWAEPAGEDRYRLRNSPFFVYGVSAEDVVTAERVQDSLLFRSVAERGGHSTYRLYLEGNFAVQDEEFQQRWQPIAALGATFESANSRFLSVDIPPTASLAAIYELFEAGEGDGFWEFEEADYQGSEESS